MIIGPSSAVFAVRQLLARADACFVHCVTLDPNLCSYGKCTLPWRTWPVYEKHSILYLHFSQYERLCTLTNVKKARATMSDRVVLNVRGCSWSVTYLQTTALPS